MLLDAPELSQKLHAQIKEHGRSREWLVPEPIRDSLPKVMPFDFDLLPETLRPWGRDICERLQCAPDYVAVTIMAALGAVVGRKGLDQAATAYGLDRDAEPMGFGRRAPRRSQISSHGTSAVSNKTLSRKGGGRTWR